MATSEIVFEKLGGKSQSGTFTINAASWNGVNLGYKPKKLYVGINFGNTGAGFCVYDEEQNISKYCYRGSAFYDRTFSDYCHITSMGFELRNEFSSINATCYYLAEG